MAQVPYSPVPDVVSSYAPTPERHVNTPEAAFGGATGAALSTLGKVTSDVGNEIYTRALAMQQLKNETDSLNAAVGYSQQGTDLYAGFKEKLGADASPEALTAYKQQLEETRQKGREGLNPMAQKMYDAHTFTYQDRLYFSGAVHSADQLKQSALVSHKMAADQTVGLAQLDPTNESNYQKALADRQKFDTDYANNAGFKDQAFDGYIAKGQSTVAAGRIGALADINLPQAKALYDKALKANTLVGEDATHVRELLFKQENLVGSKQSADELRDGTSHAMGNQKLPVEQIASGVREIESSGNYSLLEGEVGHRKIGAYSILETVKGGEIGGNFKFYLKAAGLPTSITPEQFIQDKGMQDKVFAAIAQDGLAKGHTANEIAERWQQGHYAGEGTDVVDGNNVDRAEYSRRFNAALYKGGSLDQKVAAGKAQVTKLYPDNPTLPDTTEQRIIAMHHQEVAEQRDRDFTDKNTIYAAIEAQQGKGPMTIEALQAASPEFAAVYASMKPGTAMERLQMDLVRASHQDNIETQSRQGNFNSLQGQAFIDPEAFKKADLYGADLTAKQRSDLISLHTQLLKNGVVKDPITLKAIRDPGVIAAAHSIGAGPGDNTNEWHKFTGALAEEVKFERAQGKTLDVNGINDIATKLVQDRAGTGIFGLFNSKEYQMPLHAIPTKVQNEERDFLRGKLKSTGVDREPTDIEIEQLHALRIYKATQGAKVSAR